MLMCGLNSTRHRWLFQFSFRGWTLTAVNETIYTMSATPSRGRADLPSTLIDSSAKVRESEAQWQHTKQVQRWRDVEGCKGQSADPYKQEKNLYYSWLHFYFLVKLSKVFKKCWAVRSGLECSRKIRRVFPLKVEPSQYPSRRLMA